MKVYGVIAEFNPFHNGHAYLVRSLKDGEDAAVVAIMSGSFAQRGEVALIDKYARAEAAVRCGVDLVLELPAPWCFSGAEFFALGGVGIADGIGVVDSLAFGSESGNVKELQLASVRLCSDRFADEYRRIRELDRRSNTAEVRADAYAVLFGSSDVFCGSNNLLALEYISAARKLGSTIGFETVKRVGADFNSDDLIGVCSASAIRSAVKRGMRSFSGFMPDDSERILTNEIEASRMYDMSQLDKAILARFITEEPEAFSEFMEVDEGIAYRLCDAALGSRTLDEMVDNAKTKRFSASRIRRAVLSCLLRVRMSDAETSPLFTNLLAANQTGRELLGMMRKQSRIEVLSKLSDGQRLTGKAAEQFALHMRAERLAELCCLGEPRRVGAVMV